MGKLNNYLIKEFISNILSIFSILFFITSIVFLISLSNMTALLKITFLDFSYLYILSLPQIIFFSLPISFFLALIITLSKLSDTSEIIVMFSSGIKPIKVLKPFILISIFLSFIMVFMSLYTIPMSKIIFKNFINQKKTESKLNIAPSEFGQKFGDWIVYIKQKDGNILKNNILFNTKDNTLILAKTSTIELNQNVLQFKMFNGNLFKISQNIEEMNFKQLNINNKTKIIKLKNFSQISYIKNHKKDFITFMLIALFPISTIFFVGAISIFHSRYQKNSSIIYAFIIIFIYYIIAFAIANTKNILLALSASLVVFITSFLIYKKRIKKF